MARRRRSATNDLASAARGMAKKTSRSNPLTTSTRHIAVARQACTGQDAEANCEVENNGSPCVPVRGSRIRFIPATRELGLWMRICSHTTLSQSLANTGTLIEADQAVVFAPDDSRFPFSALSEERILVARQAIADAGRLIEHPDIGTGLSCNGGGVPLDFESQKWVAIRKLVELAEAAVPMKFSILSNLTGSGGACNHAADEWTTTPLALQERLKSIKRLQQLKSCHLQLIPSIRRATTKGEVAAVLFGSLASKTDTIEPMPALDALDGQERDTITGVLTQVNDVNPSVDSWDISHLKPFSVSAAAYIVQRRARANTLMRILKSAEFFGLPPFLRSIRVGDRQAHTLSPFTNAVTPRHPLPSSNGLIPSLFPSATDLDPSCYDRPGSNYALVVQDELNHLAYQHCCFGTLVGEADQIVSLLHTSALGMHRAEVGCATVKEVQESFVEGTPAAQVGRELPEDPITPHVLAMATAAQADGNEKVGCFVSGGVRWLCDNRWNSSMSYYALLLVVALPDSCIKEEGEELSSRKPSAMAYYIAAILELTRN
ncbi:hypothetical protein ERJ75_001623300 [Trypanosoma vivax]|uniref:Uncharacterized protein n=1 Tax=Trypanosoma vivax (strain Y486) TaxID=1055687 RepID=G0TT80_TRYVY|nr:hypothetical protein TRVL_03234 [Trypanosoma vivax]KAH8605716.1 hypothetical protein ERJ75_001623300 [Trypanosoma vivax]CCC47161.1 conserved hypothetical protein [Trypanosoma vivax Y486]